MCDFADDVTDRFYRSNICEHCDWYKFPCEVQRLLPIIINNTQSSVVIKGFGNIDCTRERFKQVRLTHMQFFMSALKSSQKITCEGASKMYKIILGCQWWIFVLHVDASVYKINEKLENLLRDKKNLGCGCFC